MAATGQRRAMTVRIASQCIFQSAAFLKSTNTAECCHGDSRHAEHAGAPARLLCPVALDGRYKLFLRAQVADVQLVGFRVLFQALHLRARRAAVSAAAGAAGKAVCKQAGVQWYRDKKVCEENSHCERQIWPESSNAAGMLPIMQARTTCDLAAPFFQHNCF